MSANNPDPTLLLVEDTAEDVELLRKAFLKRGLGYQIDVSTDGQAIVERLRTAERLGRRPVAILLDLNFPFKDGREILAEIRDEQDFDDIPIIVLTTSPRPKDKDTVMAYRSTRLHAKPFRFRDYEAVLRSIQEAVAAADGMAAAGPANRR